jgi:hypothetical protein
MYVFRCSSEELDMRLGYLKEGEQKYSVGTETV